MRLTSIALRIEAHANDTETLRVSDLPELRAICKEVIDDVHSEDRNIRFAYLLLDVLSRIQIGDGVRPAARL